MAFKEIDPLVQSLTKVPAFNKERTIAFLKQYGDGFTNDDYEDINEHYFSGLGIDDDYERSFGPVTNDEQYQSYLKWKGDK